MNLVYVEGCFFHDSTTDVICVSCLKWVCCAVRCCQCGQPVCSNCFEEDRCCLMRPWGLAESQNLENIYKEKMFDMTMFPSVGVTGLAIELFTKNYKSDVVPSFTSPLAKNAYEEALCHSFKVHVIIRFLALIPSIISAFFVLLPKFRCFCLFLF